MTDPIDALLGGDALDDVIPRLARAVNPARFVRGWATVELDRAERDLGRERDPGPGRDSWEPLTPQGPTAFADAPPDDLLGARCRTGHDERGAVVLLEPMTEGRLAAALARHGEGFLALYLVVGVGADVLAAAAGFVLSPGARGPLGPERLVLTGPSQGPFVLLAGFEPSP